MIYIAAVAVFAAAVGFYFRQCSIGFRGAAIDTLIAAVFGWIAGILIGVGARIGMWSIPFFNGTEPRITFDGTLQVVLVFSLYGIGLAIAYELFFRQILKRRGLIYGLLVAILSSYPLASAASQQLSFSPAFVPMAGITLLVVGLMFVPFSILLELFLFRWHECRNEAAEALTGLHAG